MAARSTKTGDAGTEPAPAVNGYCRDGLHLWCSHKAGRYGRQPCACECHAIWKPKTETTTTTTTTSKGTRKTGGRKR
jgi:hypothetical protein